MVEDLNWILDLTTQARDSAASGSFEILRTFIQKRELRLKQMKLKKQPKLDDAQRAALRGLLSSIAGLDKQIINFIKAEMDRESRDILEITGKLKVLAAYLSGIPMERRFDRIL